jgi:hypothetical protein
MAMAPGNQAVVGGTVLRIPAIQSPDYVPGTSGWIIRQDGSAEFNAGTFRGSIEVGSLTGQHFIVNNTATGDVIDVYNSANKLIFAVSKTGVVQSFDYVNNLELDISGGQISFNNFSLTDTGDMFFSPSTGPAIQAQVAIQAFSAGPSVGALSILSGSPNNSKLPTVTGQERNIPGSIVQSDQTSTNNLVHDAQYTLTTDANGVFNQAHNCGFTPTGGCVTQRASSPGFAGAPIHTVLGDNTFTSTNFQGQCWNGAAKFTNSAVNVNIHFWG